MATDGALLGGEDDNDNGSHPNKDGADEAGRQQRDEESAPGSKTRRDPDRDARIGIGCLHRCHGQIQQ